MQNAPTIRIAHSKSKAGFTVYSFELWPQSRQGLPPLKSGWHKLTRDSLSEALEDLRAWIRSDWQSLGLRIPEIVDCGKVSGITGRTYTY